MASLDMLDKGDIHQRADVGRQLSKVGRPEHIPRLLRAAVDDPSPSVRLYAMIAVADILSRHRSGPAAAELPDDQRQALLAEVRGVDPARNAAMFSVLATLGLPRGLRPILIGLKDPRLDVRTAAVVGLFRFVISQEAAADTEVRAEVIALLEDPKVRPDVRAYLVRICAYCGWLEATPVLERFMGREDQVSQSAEQALAWMGALADPQTLLGLWWATDLDAGAVNPDPGPRRWLMLSASEAVLIDPEGSSVCAWEAAEGQLRVGEARSPLRRMILAPPGRGEERELAFQALGRTWYAAAGPDALELAEQLVEQGLGELPGAATAALVSVLVAAQPEGPGGALMAARLELASGQVQAALLRLGGLIEGKKPKVEALFWLGEARLAAGDAEGAREAWSQFLDKGPRRSPLRALAEARLGEGA